MTRLIAATVTLALLTAAAAAQASIEQQAKGSQCAAMVGGKCRSANWVRRREKCGAEVQEAYRHGRTRGAGGFQARSTAARLAVRRCMHGESW
jgi:hypothetical protein